MKLIYKIFINRRHPRYLEDFAKALDKMKGYVMEEKDFEDFLIECEEFVDNLQSRPTTDFTMDKIYSDNIGEIRIHNAGCNRHEDMIRIKYITIKGSASYSQNRENIHFEPYLI